MKHYFNQEFLIDSTHFPILPSMHTQSPYYIEKIKEYFAHKQNINPRYSLRALARDFELNPATLSLMFQRKRSLTVRSASLIATKMNLNSNEKEIFIESLKTRLKIDSIKIKPYNDNFIIDNSQYKVIAEWEHYAVLTLFDLSDFRPTPESISQRLNLDLERVEEVIANLKESGLIVEKTGHLMKSYPNIRTTESVRSKALRDSHEENLALAARKIHEVKMDFRDFSSMMIAIDPDKMSEAKTIIKEFRLKMESLMEKGHKREVYQLAIQFYPISHFPEAFEEEIINE
jgi:uncharacterized protein (TIGR02147 family)